jgi:molybdopterin-containing oxidoreductase family iron-sulfur binding subunit
VGHDKKAFEKFLHDGVLEGSTYKIVNVSFNLEGAGGLLKAAAEQAPVSISEEKVEIRFAADGKVDDGRFANNGWLQEVPDPITKLAWDNAILVSPRLAKKLGIYPHGASGPQVARVELADVYHYKEQAFIGEVTVNGRTVRGPMHIQPGLANYTVVLPLGYGRTHSGRIGTASGFNSYAARTTAGFHFTTGSIRNTGERQNIATTQEHWSMEGRDIVREANLEGEEGYKNKPLFVKEATIDSHAPANLGSEGARRPGETEEEYTRRIHGGNSTLVQKSLPRGNSLYSSPNFDGIHQWGMSIDLNTCIGCNACVVACQAENNIPIVGREQVKRGREMHWIRLDRYYSDGRIDAEAFGAAGNREIPEDPQAVVQPMTCQHCELAPCETVCPVNATVHDEEGLNVMAYNRCIGTRYCANNCPYKVRRFNYFDWNKRSLDELYMGPLGKQSEMPELVKMVKNPDVSVRMRGVMEKCTYCVQRIQQGKIAQKRKAGASGDVEVPDGNIKTACQQVCPVDAIVFGNIKDEHSAVSKAKAQDRDYAVLGYLNIRPRTTYLAKLRNPNPLMPDYQQLPLSRIEYNKKNHPSHGGAHGAAGEGHETEKHEAEHGGHG